jgi:hypothetical protein
MSFSYSTLLLFGLGLFFVTGCTTPKEKTNTVIYDISDQQECLAVVVEQEAVQQYNFHYTPSSFSLMGPLGSLLKSSVWDISRKEEILYRQSNSTIGIKEEREIAVLATKSPFFLPKAGTMDKVQIQLYRAVISMVDEARRTRNAEFINSILKDCERLRCASVANPESKKSGERLSKEGEDCLRKDNTSEMARCLARLPYQVAYAPVPSFETTTTATYTQVQTGASSYQTTTFTVTYNQAGPLVDPKTNYEVKIVRRFLDLSTGQLLGTVHETYFFNPESARGDVVSQIKY